MSPEYINILFLYISKLEAILNGEHGFTNLFSLFL